MKKIFLILFTIPFLFFIPAFAQETEKNKDKVEFGQLSDLATRGTDKGMNFHGFTEAYEHFFYPIREDTIKFFEIGILLGGSLKLWSKYFPNATIYAIDIDDKSKFNSERVKTFIADQSDRDQLGAFIKEYGSGFDVILDDGGHTMDQQQISIGYLFPHLKPGGYYIIEDVHTSLPKLYPNNGVEGNGENSTLNMIYSFLKNGNIQSQYMSRQEQQYLTKNIEYCNLFFRNNDWHSMTCIIKKKK